MNGGSISAVLGAMPANECWS